MNCSRIVVACFGLCVANLAHAQWVTSSEDVYHNTVNGNVGIGTSTPATNTRLDIVSSYLFGLTSSTSASAGIGIYGLASHSSDGFGVWGQASGTAGVGVRARATSTTGSSYGVYASSDSAGGFGIFGTATHTTGANFGLRGETKSTSGIAISGHADAATGTNYGIWVNTNSSTGYAVYATGGRNHFAGNVGIGTNNPVTKLHLDGTMRVANLAATTTATRGAMGVDASNGNVSARSFAVGNGIKSYDNAASNASWTAPGGVTKVRVRAWGGGAGAVTSAGCGAAGGYVEAFVSVVPGTTYTIDVGAGGAANGNGEASQMLDGATVILSADGAMGYTPGQGSVNSNYVDTSACIIEQGTASAFFITDMLAPPSRYGRIIGVLSQKYVITVGSGGLREFGSAAATPGYQGSVVLEW